MTTTTTIRAAIYTRISQDTEGKALGVQRQEKECRELARRRGWQVVDVYTDNDLSAYNGKVRPAYQRLIEDIRNGAITAVITWHADRLHRSTHELLTFVDVVQQAGCAVETVQSGDLNLFTPSGKAVAVTLSAWSRYESEQKSVRLKAKHRQLAEAGQDAGGGRPFGYENDRKAVRMDEARLVAEAADRVLQGESVRRIAIDWNGRGIKSVTGRAWTVQVLKRMLCSARISGRRERRTDAQGKKHDVGIITADTAVWQPIISVEKSDRLRALLVDPSRRQGGRPSEYLLTGGLARCGLCGASLVARPKGSWQKGQPSIPSLVCAKGPGFKGCGGIRIASGPLEELVSEVVLRAIDKGALARALRGKGEDRKAVDELHQVEQKLADLAEDWANDRRTRGEWEAARKTLVARQDALRRRVEASRRHVGLGGLTDPLRAAWPSLELHRRRAVISTLVEAVVIGRGVRGLNQFDSRRVTLKWKA